MFKHGTYTVGKSSSEQYMDQEPNPSDSAIQEQLDEFDAWMDGFGTDDDEESRKERLSLLTPKKPASVVQSCQRNPKAPPITLLNQDLFYLKHGNLGTTKYTLLLHKYPAVPYLDDDIEERTSRWVSHEHKFITKLIVRKANGKIDPITEPYYKYLNKNDIKDLYLLCINGKVDNYKETGLLGLLTIFIRTTVIWERVQDFQLCMEIGMIYENNKKENRVMIHKEIHKFCDATLKRVLEKLKKYNKDVKYGYVDPSPSDADVEYLRFYEEDIENHLNHQDQLRRWEMYVNGRPLGSRRDRQNNRSLVGDFQVYIPIKMFCHADRSSVKVLKDSIEEFGKVVRLILNYNKSTIIFGSLNNEEKQAILEVMSLVDKVESKVFNWKNKYLTYAGRLMLVASILESIHVYWAFVILLPEGVIKDINKILKDFLWNQNDGTKGRPKVTWKKVKWVNTEKLKGKSIWEIEEDKNDSWGPFDQFINYRTMYNGRFRSTLTVKEWMKHSNGEWPEGWTSKFSSLLSLQTVNLNEQTKDSGGRSDSDSHSHLFFECEYSKSFWGKALEKMGVFVSTYKWNNIVDEMSRRYNGNSVNSIIRRLCFAASVYIRWPWEDLVSFYGQTELVHRRMYHKEVRMCILEENVVRMESPSSIVKGTMMPLSYSSMLLWVMVEWDCQRSSHGGFILEIVRILAGQFKDRAWELVSFQALDAGVMLNKDHGNHPNETSRLATEFVGQTTTHVIGWDQGLLGMCAGEKCKSKSISLNSQHIQFPVHGCVATELVVVYNKTDNELAHRKECQGSVWYCMKDVLPAPNLIGRALENESALNVVSP
ncbi:hypothetical protein Tco_0536800 [Tanacetum coccineum]